jgi:NACHT domain
VGREGMSMSLITVSILQYPLYIHYSLYSFSDGSASSTAATLMSLPRADYASHDSGRKDAHLSCLQGTRVAVLDEIVSWLESKNGETPSIYWLNGLAGIGKSTIAKTVAERAEEREMFGASFFFSQGDGRLRDPQLVFPTIAFQLAHSDDEFKKVILDAVQEDMTLGTKTLLPQLSALIITPLLKVHPNRRATLIILDALDECEENGAVEILRLLFSHGTRIPFLRILITSRPEHHISSVFDEAPNVVKRILHDIEGSVIEQDIRFYLRTELSKIPHNLRLRMGPNWISEDEINLLTEKSGKLFVYAATSIRFIGDNRVRNPRRHLHLILSTQTGQKIGATPYTQLDNLYMGVLLKSLSDSNRRDVVERFQVVVGSIIFLREPLPLSSLARFVQYEIEEIDAALYHLGSVIIPASNEDDAPHIYHPSFRDFVMDASRCSDPDLLIVPSPNQERRHVIRCFELLAGSLKRDIAGISDPSLLNEEVDGFEEKVREAILPEVRYACRYWAFHLSCVELGDETVAKELERFLMRSLLWWFEAMSLIGSIPTAVHSILEAHRWAVSGFDALSLDEY